MPRTTRYHPTGAIVWEGPSRINGEPIVLLVTGLFNPSNNPKTGPMHQTWIFHRDIHPYEAICNGMDASICGQCPLRLNPDTGKRACYVMAAPLGQIWKAYQKGRYKPVDLNLQSEIWFDLKPLRIGAYGDPAAVPIEILQTWVASLKAAKMLWTGYTRRWMLPENQPLKEILMASIFSRTEQQQAMSLGWRTYRVLPNGSELPPKSIICPGSEEGGFLKTCRECFMCRGTSARTDIVVYAHGGGGKHFTEVLP